MKNSVDNLGDVKDKSFSLANCGDTRLLNFERTSSKQRRHMSKNLIIKEVSLPLTTQKMK
mgnify:CR=1 FL=1